VRRQPPSAFAVIAITSMAFFMVPLDSLIVVTALPAISREVGGNLTDLSWIINAYALTFAAGIAPAAALGDRYGRRVVFSVGLFLFAVGSTVCAMAPSLTTLVAARALQGLGAATIMPLSLTILTTTVAPEKRGTALGIWSGIAGIGGALGPLVGGILAQLFGWHWIFWLNVPIALLAGVLALVVLPESYGPRARIDALAIALMSIGAAGLVWALVRGPEVGWLSAETLATSLAGAVCLAALVAWETHASAPLFPPRLFKNKRFVAANATSFLTTAGIFGAAVLVAQYFQIVHGLSPLQTSLWILPWTGATVPGVAFFGALSDRVGRRWIMALGAVVQGLPLLILAFIGSAEGSLPLESFLLFLSGLGISMVVPTVPATALGAVPPDDIGSASGANGIVQRLGSAFGVAIAAAAFAAFGSVSAPGLFLAGFRPALIVASLLSVVAIVTALASEPQRKAASLEASA